MKTDLAAGNFKECMDMPIEATIKENWEKLQEKYNVPVDALGRPIDPKDQETLKVWHEEGIDRFLLK
jgi:hypothetical protein